MFPAQIMAWPWEMLMVVSPEVVTVAWDAQVQVTITCAAKGPAVPLLLLGIPTVLAVLLLILKEKIDITAAYVVSQTAAPLLPLAWQPCKHCIAGSPSSACLASLGCCGSKDSTCSRSHGWCVSSCRHTGIKSLLSRPSADSHPRWGASNWWHLEGWYWGGGGRLSSRRYQRCLYSLKMSSWYLN